jgi:hypothetical protein
MTKQGELCSRPACENAALKPDLKLDQEPTPPGRQTSQKELLESSPWLTDADFQEKIDAVSRDLGSLVKGYQTIFQHDWRKLPQKDRRDNRGKDGSRKHFIQARRIKVGK